MSAPERLDRGVQLGELVLRERLGREEVERAGVRVLQDAVEDRQVVAERLARGGRRDDDDVAPRARPARRPRAGACRGRSMPRACSASRSFGCSASGKPDELRRLRREVPQRGQHRLGAERLLDLEGLEDGEQCLVALGTGRDELLAHVVASGAGPRPGGRASGRIMPQGRSREVRCRGSDPRPVEPPRALPRARRSRPGEDAGDGHRPGAGVQRAPRRTGYAVPSARSPREDAHADAGGRPGPAGRPGRGPGPRGARQDARARREGVQVPDQRLRPGPQGR